MRTDLPSPAITPVRIQHEDFDLSTEVRSLHATVGTVGAVCTFIGTVRVQDQAVQDAALAVQALELEHYPGMTERAIEAMVEQAHQRFAIQGARIVHRVGKLLPGEQIVLVAVSASHRHESFQACEFLMDYLKTQAPFWKKETTAQGAHWVDARSTDDAALQRWGIASSNAG